MQGHAGPGNTPKQQPNSQLFRRPQPNGKPQVTALQNPYPRRSETRATFTPDTAWPVSGSPARLIPKLYTHPGFDAISCFSMLQQWFAHARLSDPCLTTLTPPFPQSLTTTVFSQCSTRRLDVSLRRATPKGHKTFISYTALLHKGRPTLQPPCRIRGTRAA